MPRGARPYLFSRRIGGRLHLSRNREARWDHRLRKQKHIISVGAQLIVCCGALFYLTQAESNAAYGNLPCLEAGSDYAFADSGCRQEPVRWCQDLTSWSAAPTLPGE